MRWFQKPDPEFWRTLILTVVVGLVSGALGALAAWSSLLAYRTRLILEPTPTLTERRSTSESEALLRVLADKVVPATAHLFLLAGDEPAYFLPHEAVGTGLVLTADGWIITHESVVSPRRLPAIRVGIGGSLARVRRIVADLETGVLFLKTDATNLRAAVFGKSAALIDGDVAYALRDTHGLQFVRIEEAQARDAVETSSDTIGTRLFFDGFLPPRAAGGAIVTGAGEVVGILRRDETGSVQAAVPIDQVAPLFDNLLGDGTLVRPSLGVRGLHLAGGWSASGRARGFLIQGDDRDRAITRGSPAEEAGLSAGDIILKVNDTVLNGDADLAELLLTFRPGETIDLEIQRDDELLTVPVTLGERKSGKTY